MVHVAPGASNSMHFPDSILGALAPLRDRPGHAHPQPGARGPGRPRSGRASGVATTAPSPRRPCRGPGATCRPWGQGGCHGWRSPGIGRDTAPAAGRPRGGLAITFGDVRVVDGARPPMIACLAWGFDGSVMEGHDDSQRSDGLAVTQRDERCGSRLTRIWAGLYTRPRMGTDTIQPDYRLPTSRAAADLAAPVLTAAPLSGTIDACGAQPPRICASNGRRSRLQTPPVDARRRCRHLY